MVKYYDSIEPHLAEWALEQSVFFTASAPLTGRHVNISPKGLPSSSFSILGPRFCGYVDATGSGNETISHILENGRVTVMFCSFGPSPRILRFFCTGKVVEYTEQPEFDSWMKRMGDKKVPGARAVILLDVFKVQTSCGFGVPYLSLRPDANPSSEPTMIPYLADRDTMGHWAGKKIERGELTGYQKVNNHESLDGLPGLRAARRDMGESLWYGDLKATVRRNLAASTGGGVSAMMVVVALVSALWTVMVMVALGLVKEEVVDKVFLRR